MLFCDFVKGCCIWPAARTLEIHICQDCKRQIVFVRGAIYKCSICWHVFDDGHSMAMHYHKIEKDQCKSFYDILEDPKAPDESEPEKRECVPPPRRSSAN